MGHARAGGVKHQVKPLRARVNDQPESDIEPAFVPAFVSAFGPGANPV
jgi:hypothetical protein